MPDILGKGGRLFVGEEASRTAFEPLDPPQTDLPPTETPSADSSTTQPALLSRHMPRSLSSTPSTQTPRLFVRPPGCCARAREAAEYREAAEHFAPRTGAGEGVGTEPGQCGDQGGHFQQPDPTLPAIHRGLRDKQPRYANNC
ncbi:hypothetical protein GCM10009863_64780 [Streptomyces axinellae]|uniref:Uncharacterized protein n=1 Tax=Streptomyces axinellae TaxID=552788 RepID=A0ABN3QZI2_9ACTN